MELLNRAAPGVLGRYSPQRDLLLIFADLIVEAAAGLSPERIKHGNDAEEVMTALNITPEQVINAIGALGMAAGHFTSDKVQTPKDALNMAGVLELPGGERTVALAQLGQVTVRAFFTFARNGAFDGMEDVCLSRRVDIMRQISASRRDWAIRRSWWRRLLRWLGWGYC